MINKISEVGNEITDASVTRIFSIVEDSLVEETPGTKMHNKPVPLDQGIVGKTALLGKTINTILPRRESVFSVAIDDITEPRV